jgi:formylglycine-generating enzyme required for sulfatase activity
MPFVLVPAGTFWIGGGGGTPGERQATIAHDFNMGVFPVTQGQWQTLMGNNPSWFSRMGDGKEDVKQISDAELQLFPVEQVSWEDAQQFIERLNASERGSGWVYRLPTEAEWEYACRGGATTREECSYHFYFASPDDSQQLIAQPTNGLSSHDANFNGNYPAGNASKGPYLQRTSKVGSYRPNKLGIYDLHGNVWEWCADAVGPVRVFRGGGWGRSGPLCRAADRNWCAPSVRSDSLGFRVARVPFGK